MSFANRLFQNCSAPLLNIERPLFLKSFPVFFVCSICFLLFDFQGTLGFFRFLLDYRKTSACPQTNIFLYSRSLVEMKGFEPLTPCLQGRCSPNWATPPRLFSILFLVGSSGFEPPTLRLSGARSNHLSYEPVSLPPSSRTLKIEQQ